MSKLIKKLLLAFTLFSLISFIAIFSVLWTYSNKLPDYKFLKNYKPSVSSKVYSGEGVLKLVIFPLKKEYLFPLMPYRKK